MSRMKEHAQELLDQRDDLGECAADQAEQELRANGYDRWLDTVNPIIEKATTNEIRSETNDRL